MSTMTVACDASARPVGLIPVTTAVSRLACALAGGDNHTVALVSDEQVRFRTADRRLDIPKPLVVMTTGYVELEPRDVKRVSRRVLFARDRFQCQYCGMIAPANRAMKLLTVDHVKPARLFETREAATTWDNCVAACSACNARKGGQLPRDCKMWPRRTPTTPSFVQLRFSGRLTAAQRDYVATYFSQDPEDL